MHGTPGLLQGDRHAHDIMESGQNQLTEIGDEIFDSSPNPKLYITGKFCWLIGISYLTYYGRL